MKLKESWNWSCDPLFNSRSALSCVYHPSFSESLHVWICFFKDLVDCNFKFQGPCFEINLHYSYRALVLLTTLQLHERIPLGLDFQELEMFSVATFAGIKSLKCQSKNDSKPMEAPLKEGLIWNSFMTDCYNVSNRRFAKKRFSQLNDKRCWHVREHSLPWCDCCFCRFPLITRCRANG